MSEPAAAPAHGWDDGVLASLYQVAFAHPDHELAGVLVGTPAADGVPPRIHAVIPSAQSTVPEQAARFSHQTWAYIHQAMAAHYQELEVVGWYVSRPGEGTELRDSEQANHLLWFNRGQQILLVLDSRSHRGALYQPGTDGRLLRMHEGPVARRHARPPAPAGRPWAALTILICLGVLAGAFAFVLTEALSSL